MKAKVLKKIIDCIPDDANVTFVYGTNALASVDFICRGDGDDNDFDDMIKDDSGCIKIPKNEYVIFLNE